MIPDPFRGAAKSGQCGCPKSPAEPILSYY
jgi:hypothetical protein